MPGLDHALQLLSFPPAGIRLIAEQHLALSASHTAGPASKTSVGIIDTCLSAAQLVQGCADFVGQLCESSLGCAPELILEGDTKSTFVGVASHLVSRFSRTRRSCADRMTTCRRTP